MGMDGSSVELIARTAERSEVVAGASSYRVVHLDGFEPPFTLAPEQREPYLRRFSTLFIDDARTRRGSAGSVLHAINAFGERFALKVRNPIAGSDVCFSQEYEAHRRVSEIKGFPRLFGIATLEGEPVLVMEWIEGEPLYRVCMRMAVDEAGRISPLNVARLGRDLFNVLARTDALEDPVVHGDLSLGNIMICTAQQSLDGQVQEGSFDIRVIDLSSARVQGAGQGAVSSQPMSAATPEFAAPEMEGWMVTEDNASPTSAADVHAAASILLHLLHGRDSSETAHGLQNDVSAVLLHEPEVAVAVSRAASDLSPAPSAQEVADALLLAEQPLEDILRSCLEEDPCKRPTAGAMRTALGSFCSGYALNIARALRGEVIEPCTAPFIYKGADRLSRRARTLIRVIGKGLSYGLLLAVMAIAAVVVIVQDATIVGCGLEMRGAFVLPWVAALCLPAVLGIVFRGRIIASSGGFGRGSVGVLLGGAVLLGMVLAASFEPGAFKQLFFAAVFAATAMAWCPLVLDFAFPAPSARVRKRRRALPEPQIPCDQAANALEGEVDGAER